MSIIHPKVEDIIITSAAISISDRVGAIVTEVRVVGSAPREPSGRHRPFHFYRSYILFKFLPPVRLVLRSMSALTAVQCNLMKPTWYSPFTFNRIAHDNALDLMEPIQLNDTRTEFSLQNLFWKNLEYTTLLLYIHAGLFQ